MKKYQNFRIFVYYLICFRNYVD